MKSPLKEHLAEIKHQQFLTDDKGRKVGIFLDIKTFEKLLEALEDFYFGTIARSTGAVYPRAVRRAILNFADQHGLLILADEVYGDLGFDGPVEPLGILDPDAAIIWYSVSPKCTWRRAGGPAGWRLAKLHGWTPLRPR